MGRITGPVCRLCRRDGLKLFLKGSRCDTPKCAFERRSAPPGMVQKRRGKPTDYGLHLREKQKVKHYYGVLERQFRYPLDRVLIEFPAGKLDEGEDSLLCVQRELREETGYTATEWAYAGVMHPTIAYSTEHIDIWFARKLVLGDRRLDQGEFLDVFTATPARLLQWCRSGEVVDGKSLVGALWLHQVLQGAWELDWAPAPE